MQSQSHPLLILRCIVLTPSFSSSSTSTSLSPWSSISKSPTPVSTEFTLAIDPTSSISHLAQKIVNLELVYFRQAGVHTPADVMLWQATPAIPFEELAGLRLDERTKKEVSTALDLLSSTGERGKRDRKRQRRGYGQGQKPRPRAIALPVQKAVGQYFLPQYDARSTRAIHVLIQTYAGFHAYAQPVIAPLPTVPLHIQRLHEVEERRARRRVVVEDGWRTEKRVKEVRHEIDKNRLWVGAGLGIVERSLQVRDAPDDVGGRGLLDLDGSDAR